MNVWMSKQLLIPARRALFQNKGEAAVPVTFWPKCDSLEVQTFFISSYSINLQHILGVYPTDLQIMLEVYT